MFLMENHFYKEPLLKQLALGIDLQTKTTVNKCAEALEAEP